MSSGIFRNIDWGLLAPVFVLVIISLTTLMSINGDLFKNQLMFSVFSLIVFLLFTQINYSLLKTYALPIYVISLLLLLIVVFVGMESRGAIRWIDIFGIRIQFSEVLKPFLALSLASFLYKRSFNLKTIFLVIAFLLPIAILIAIQPDLGNAVVYAVSAIFTLLLVGFPIKWFFGGFILFLGTIPIAWNFFHTYQKQRILAYLDPSKDPLGTSYNAIQSVIAVGSGMFFGKGFSEATQSTLKFLPEHHTDFIFATISEGLGFIGSIIVLAAFVFLFLRIYVIFSTSNEKFCKIFVIISFSVLCVQFFVNVGMNIGILPVVGITLPFVSYGGSSLLSNFIFLGFLSSIKSNARKKEVLEIR